MMSTGNGRSAGRSGKARLATTRAFEISVTL